MIRVLHYIGGLGLGGAQSAVIEIYRNIDRTKIQFDFVIHDLNDNNYNDELNALGAKIFVCPKFNGKNLKQYYKWWDCFFKEHSEYKILHSHIRGSATICLKIAKGYGVKTIIHSHSTSNGVGVSALVKKVMQFPLRYQADYFFGCSQKSGEWLFGKKIVSGDRFFVIKNAIKTDEYKADGNVRNQYRKELGIEENAIVYVHVGRLHEAKNHMFLLELFAGIVKKNPKDVLLLVGDGELRNQIVERINELDLSRNVIMMGARKDVANILKASDCLLFPSNWEGLPVTVVEAQAAGLPCLISDRITDEVNITSLVKKLPIDQGVSCWIEAIENVNFKKSNVTKEIFEAGFDIRQSVEWLQSFYKTI